MTATPPKYMSPGRLAKFREEQARKRAARAARGRKSAVKKQPAPPRPARAAPPRPARAAAPRPVSLSSEHTADAAEVAALLSHSNTSSMLRSAYGSTGIPSFKPPKPASQNLDEMIMQGRRDVYFPSTSREAARTGSASTTIQHSLRAMSENLKRNSFAVVGGKRGKKGKGGSAGGRLQGKRRKFVPLRKVRDPKRVQALVIGGGGGSPGSGSFGGGGGGAGVYVSPDPDAVRALTQIARSPLPPKPSRKGTPLQKAMRLEKAVRKMVRSLRPKNKRCPKGTRRGFGNRCYSPTMLQLLRRIRAQIKVMRAHERNMAMLRRMRKGKTLAGSVKRSLAKTYGAREIRLIAAKKMTLPRGAKLERSPLRKVKGKIIYRYRLRR